jgi:osmoprotectant transport system ATP-binding protein
MIRFTGVSKRFADAARPAVDAIHLTIPEGETCALIGPSGCGKSTTLRMVNRLVEPDAGTIHLAGEALSGIEPIRLRRRIGYVLQGVGLFPHWTVARNIATVPELLGWSKTRTAARINAMLDLVGLDPDEFRGRRPDALSGGQRQRVGVARALAADPPVLLMDEPFGAVDPVARGRLQTEIGAILKRLNKTVILVTHDLDEAVRMGDRIVLMRDGRIVQADTPDRLLARPADGFVADFVGPDRALRRLAGLHVGDLARLGSSEDGPVIAYDAPVRDALSLMLATGADHVRVAGLDEPSSLSLAAIRAASAPAG